jgi:hypothetical protein
MSAFANAEIFAATTLLVVLGTSVITSLAGLSLALGAFLAGLLIAETEYAMQVGRGAAGADPPRCRDQAAASKAGSGSCVVSRAARRGL